METIYDNDNVIITIMIPIDQTVTFDSFLFQMISIIYSLLSPLVIQEDLERRKRFDFEEREHHTHLEIAPFSLATFHLDQRVP